MTSSRVHVEHVCHTRRCMTSVSPRFLMCRRHWCMVPYGLRLAVWATYVSGQEVRKDPTVEYLAAAQDAIHAVAEKEGLVA